MNADVDGTLNGHVLLLMSSSMSLPSNEKGWRIGNNFSPLPWGTGSLIWRIFTMFTVNKITTERTYEIVLHSKHRILSPIWDIFMFQIERCCPELKYWSWGGAGEIIEELIQFGNVCLIELRRDYWGVSYPRWQYISLTTRADIYWDLPKRTFHKFICNGITTAAFIY